MQTSRCSRPPPPTCWPSRNCKLSVSLPPRRLTGRQLLCILFIYIAQKCTERKGGGRDFKSISPQTAGKTVGSPAGCAAHCGHCAGAVLYHCAGVAQHPAVLSAGCGAHRGGHHVLYTGRRNEHDPHGRACGCCAHPEPQTAGDPGRRLSAGVPHHHFGAGPAGAGQSGALHPQPDPDLLGGGGRGPVPHRRVPAHAAGRGAAAAAGGILRPCIRAGCLCAPGVSGRGL